VRVLEADGAIRNLASYSWLHDLGIGRQYQDGPAAQARFSAIRGLAMDGDGTVFVADHGNRLFRKISPQGEVTTLAGNKQGLRMYQA